MNKRVLCDYLGVSAPIVDNLIKFDGLNVAAFTPSRNDGKTNTLFIKERVLEWELKGRDVNEVSAAIQRTDRQFYRILNKAYIEFAYGYQIESLLVYRDVVNS